MKFAALAAGLAVTLSIPQNPPQPDPMSGLIVGQVVDAESGLPLGGSVVSIVGPPAGDRVPTPRLLTGSDGRFVFRRLRKGNYNLLAFKQGYVEGAYGRTRRLARQRRWRSRPANGPPRSPSGCGDTRRSRAR